MKKILIIAGEPSGDLHASRLVKDLKTLDPGLRFFGLGGYLSKEAGVEAVFDISGLALVGLTDVLKNIFTVGKIYKGILRRIDMEKPDLAILIDYPGFNLRLAGELKKRSVPVVYYISPQVWAWGRDRIDIIKRCVTKMIVFFRFEEELYRRYGVDAVFAGCPLVDTVKAPLTKDETIKIYDLSRGKTTIALLPGSRTSEIKTLLGVMIGAAKIMNGRMKDLQFLVARYPALPSELYSDAVKDSGLDIRIASGDTYNVLAASDFAIVASGTATLETAIIGTPLVIIYKANILTYVIYKLVATVPFLGIVNIVAGREIAPELLQDNATPQKIAGTILPILSNGMKLKAMREELAKVRSSLGAPGAGMRAAQAIIPLLK